VKCFVGEIDLLTFTITVSNNAALGLTEPFTISFENVPTNAGGDELKMLLPCGNEFCETNIIGRGHYCGCRKQLRFFKLHKW